VAHHLGPPAVTSGSVRVPALGGVVVVLALAGSAGAAAQPALEPLVVTGSRAFDDPLAPLRKIPPDELARGRGDTVLDVLNADVSVRAHSRGGVGGPSYLSVRSGEPNFTLVLLEGAPLNDPTNSAGGAFDFGQIDPDALSGVEFAPGGFSGVQGANALSGVVNLRLRGPGDLAGRADARVQVDTRGLLGVGGALAFGDPRAGLMLQASRLDTGERHAAELERTQVAANAVYAGERVRLQGFAVQAWTDSIGFPEESGGPRLAVLRDRQSREARLQVVGGSLRAADAAGRLTWMTTASASRQDSRVAVPGIAPGVFDGVPATTSDARYTRADLTSYLRRRDGRWTAVLGAGWTRETGRDDGSIDVGVVIRARFRATRETVSAFGQVGWDARPVRVEASLRIDDTTVAAARLTGRLDAEAEVSPGWTLRAAASESYKLPSLYGLGHPLVGNPDLRPESAEGVEAGLERRWADRAAARLTLFHTHYRDLVDFDPVAFRIVNRAKVDVTGVEVEAEVDLTRRARLRAGAALRDYDSDVPLRGRSRWKGVVALDLTASDRVTLFARATYDGSASESSIPTGFVARGAGVDLALGGRVRLDAATDLALIASDVLNAAPTPAIGFPPEGPTLRAVLARRF
jgi:vitamin B12 transporter